MTKNNKRPRINSLGKAIGKTERPHDRNDFVFSDDPAKWGVFGSSRPGRKEWERQKKRKVEKESKRSGKKDFHRKHG